MSFDFNYKLWLSTKKDLSHLLKKQDILKGQEPVGDAGRTLKILSQMYILYSELVAKLGYLYSETFQVQKKQVIYKLIEPAIQRLQEIKTKLKEVELSVYVYLDKTLVERKLTPYDVLIWTSSFLHNRPKDLKAVFHEPKRFRDISHEDIVKAITKIQSHERARKGRLFDRNKIYDNRFSSSKISYTFSHKSDFPVLVPVKRTMFPADFMKTSTKCEQLMNVENFQKENSVDETEILEQQTNSALIIQRAWKNYKAQKLLKANLDFKRTLYGLVKPKKIMNLKEYEENILRINKKYTKQEELNNKYQQLMYDEHDRLLEEKRNQIMEDISDHIRDWFREFYEKAGAFHPYPDASKSGTVLLLTDETMTLSEFREYLKTQELSKAERKNLEEKRKQQKLKENEQKEKERLKEMKARAKMLKTGVYDIGHELRNNHHIQNMEKQFAEYSIDWKNVDEYLNKSQDAIKEWITERQLVIIHKELRRLVDKYMRVEYNMLKKAWCADNGGKFKPLKTKEKKASRKKKKSKATADPTADRTIESLYEELETAGLIQNYPVKGFDDYLGDFNLLADDFRNENSNLVTAKPAKADIKFALQEILFGMGAFNVEKSKALCLVGPANTGKRLLCNIIASELGALVIDLSPEKTVQFSDNVKYFIHIVMKVAKAFQPTILFIEDAHRVFWKKVPKDQKVIKPTLLRSALNKSVLRSIGKKDKIMLIGTSSLPWSANKMLTKVFQNFLLIPESNYSTIYLMWHELLSQNINRTHFEDSILSVLAKIFQKYNSGDITDNFSSTLDIKRRMRLHSNPINPDEFLDYFCAETNPVFPPEEKVLQKYEKWYKNTEKYAKMRLQIEAEKNKKKK